MNENVNNRLIYKYMTTTRSASSTCTFITFCMYLKHVNKPWAISTELPEPRKNNTLEQSQQQKWKGNIKISFK